MNSDWIWKIAHLSSIYFESIGIEFDLTYNNWEPFQFMIDFLLHGDPVRIGSKEIFTWSPADLYEQRERGVLFASADLHGWGRLHDELKEATLTGGQYLDHSILELSALTTRLPHLLILASPETQIL